MSISVSVYMRIMCVICTILCAALFVYYADMTLYYTLCNASLRNVFCVCDGYLQYGLCEYYLCRLSLHRRTHCLLRHVLVIYEMFVSIKRKFLSESSAIEMLDEAH